MTLQETIATPAPQLAAPPQQQLWGMIMGCFASQSIAVAAQLEIADRLAERPQTAAELAEATGSDARSLYRLLRALAGIGVFAEDAQGRFTLTPLAEPMRRDVPGSMHAACLLIGSTLQWPALGHLAYSIRTGQPAFADLFGMDQWAYMEQNLADYELFHYAMTSFSAGEIRAILAAYDFGQVGTLVDIAGGQGKLLSAILAAHPALRGVLFEIPEIARQARQTFLDAGVAERCEIVSGDMFQHVPARGDVFMMKTVIHDWNDDQVVSILRSCAAAMQPGARLLIITRVVQAGNVPDSSKFMDLNMMITMGGGERTAEEIERLIGIAGFSRRAIIPTRCPLSIVECVRDA